MKKTYSVDDKLATINDNYSRSHGITASRIVEMALVNFYNNVARMEIPLPKERKAGRPITTIR